MLSTGLADLSARSESDPNGAEQADAQLRKTILQSFQPVPPSKNPGFPSSRVSTRLAVASGGGGAVCVVWTCVRRVPISCCICAATSCHCWAAAATAAWMVCWNCSGAVVIKARQLTQHCNTAEVLVRSRNCRRPRGCSYADCSATTIAQCVESCLFSDELWKVRHDSHNIKLVSVPEARLTVTRAARRQTCTSGFSVTAAAVSVVCVSQRVTGFRVR